MKKLRWFILTGVAMVLFLGIYGYVVPQYFEFANPTPAANSFSPLSRRVALWIHFGFGGVAFLIGLYQHVTTASGGVGSRHRALGKTYVAAIYISAAASLALSATSEVNWVFTLGLLGLAVAWVSTTTMAVVAIRLGQREQHREWMIRSYVVTFSGFIVFRLSAGLFGWLQLGDIFEQIAAAAWLCWSGPLLITEVVLQSKRLRAHRASSSGPQPVDGAPRDLDVTLGRSPAAPDTDSHLPGAA